MNDSERYSRQTRFQPIGVKGQNLIESKHVLIVGVGALGTHTAELLTRAGVQKLTLIDRDYVDLSNLQRQQLFTEADVELKWPKVIAAKEKLQQINQSVIIEAIVGHADSVLLENLLHDHDVDLLIDGLDNFDTRFLLNDLAQKYEIPYLFGSCTGSFGMAFSIIPGKTPCLQCLLKRVPLSGQTCDTVGVIAPIVQMVSAHQGAEALKILSGNREKVREAYVSFDLWENDYLSLKVDAMKDRNCFSCGEAPTYPFLSEQMNTRVTTLCGRDTVQIRPSTNRPMLLEQLISRWRSSGYEVGGNPFLVSVIKDELRAIFFQDGRALIHGTNDPNEARKIYHSLVG